MRQPTPRRSKMITMGAMASKPEDNSILVDDDDDDNDQQVIEVPSDADFSATDSVDDYIPISSASSSEEDSDRPRSRRSTGSRRSSSVTSSSARRRERPPQQQPQQKQPTATSPTTPRNIPNTMRKRSMSLFAEPDVIIDEVLDDELSSDDDDDLTATTNSAVGGAPGNWSTGEKESLLLAIESLLPATDNFSYTRRLKALDWRLVQIAGRSAQDCKEQLMELLKKVRHVRTVRELLGDVRVDLQNPKAPRNTSSYLLFCRDYRRSNPSQGRESMTKWAEAFRQLSAEQREHYEMLAAELRNSDSTDRKQAKLQAELQSAPDTPFTLYCREQVEQRFVTKLQLRSDYSKLPDDEKLVFVRQAVELAKANGSDAIELLSAKEMRLLKAPKTMNGYNLFMREYYQGNANTTSTDMSKRYRELSEAERNDFKVRAARLKEEFKEPTIKPKAAVNKVIKSEGETFDKPKSKKNAANGVAVAEELPSPIRKPDTPGKKVKKLLQTSLNFSGKSLAESTLLQPMATPEKKHSKRKSNGDEAAVDEQRTPVNTAGRRSIKLESSSETDTSSAKKRRIKTEKPRVVMVEPAKVPTSVFAYYAERVFEGKPKKAKKAFDQLDAAERKTLKKEARKCMSEYMERLERYLKSLSKSEMVEYANRSRQLATDQTDEDFMGSSSSD